MKKIFQIILIICLSAGYSKGQQLTVATYNLRGDDLRDVGNEWTSRKFMVTDQIQKHQFDIIGMQETNANMAGYLTSVLPKFDSIGVFMNIGTGILYNKERLQLKDHGFFWLSPTPDVESKGWDAKYKRICVWGKFKDLITGGEYYFFNSHFDHIGIAARTNSTKLILQRIKEMAGNTPVVLLGDLNTTQYDPNYMLFNNSGLKDSYNLAVNIREKERGTGNGFNINRRQRIRVDYIFLSQTLKAYEYNVLTDLYNNHTASDHYCVMATIGIKANEAGDLYRQFPEDFENITKTGYAREKVAARTGSWIFEGATLGGSSGNDKPTSGTYAVRMVNGNTTPAYLQMDFDITEGASKVILQHGLYATDSVSRWQLEYSTNQGSSWTPTGPVVVTHQGNKQQAVFIMDLRGKIRFRIHKLELGVDNNGRLSIDDIAIYKRQNTGAEQKNVNLLAWQFDLSTANKEQGANSSFNNKAINKSTLTRGDGLIAKNAGSYPIRLSNGFIAAANTPSSVSASDTSTAISNKLYLEFKVNPVKMNQVSLSTLDVRLMTTGKNKKLFYWKYSLDGSNYKSLAKPYEFTGVFPASQHTINLSVYPELQKLTAEQTVYFRLYVNGLNGVEDMVGIGCFERINKNTFWANPDITKDYVLQLQGFTEAIKKSK
ncbi:endonuclease/exonuclease/phosphatase family protein [Pedobacter metabolipauper]|uniref:Endonuclease/exonuclease/phosphatase family metal-dependent hydrolase n=1 Tax=Pedobacter metabolipauper TaxID=425513 RepID=A0A4R6SZI5_9SPHI|nr:endonuclease/exonuclease/phosphatase family protein [Pedobacter metabolipauper]TDQ11497.1 endonuclease/exonuclease/phosphatase family metal-dependent hydrolase [Pedobacter metabolipauper]